MKNLQPRATRDASSTLMAIFLSLLIVTIVLTEENVSAFPPVPVCAGNVLCNIMTDACRCVGTPPALDGECFTDVINNNPENPEVPNRDCTGCVCFDAHAGAGCVPECGLPTP